MSNAHYKKLLFVVGAAAFALAPAAARAAPSGSITVSITHPGGGPVDVAHPAPVLTPLVLHISFSATGLAAGQYAYAAYDLCDRYLEMTNTNPTVTLGTCNSVYGTANGYHAGYKLASQPVAASGVDTGSGLGVTEDFQLTIYSGNYFIPDGATWTVPARVMVGNGPSPDPADIQVASGSGGAVLSSVRLATTAVYPSTAVPTVRNNVAGYDFTFLYLIYNIDYWNYSVHFLDGTSTIHLLPPTITNNLTATLVSATVGPYDLFPAANAPIYDEHQAFATYGINANQNLVVPNDGSPPYATIDNLSYVLPWNTAYIPSYYVTWFIPKPTQPNTVMTVHGSVEWNGNNFTSANIDSYSAYAPTSQDISPIPIADLRTPLYHTCYMGPYDQFNATGVTAFGTDWNNGVYGSYPYLQYPAVNGNCLTTYLGDLSFEFAGSTAQAMSSNKPATMLNPTYVFKVDPNEKIITPSLANSGGWSVDWSTDPNCDNTTTAWTPIATPPTPSSSDWTSVTCVRYQYPGFLSTNSAYLVRPFTTRLRVDTGAVGEVKFTIEKFWVTADNVLADATTGNVWGNTNIVSAWQNTTVLFAYYQQGGPAGVGTVLAPVAESWLSGLSIPDWTIEVALPPGAVWDTSVSPNSWVNSIPTDDSGAPCTLSCSILNASHAACTLTPTAGHLIPATRTDGNANFFLVYARFLYVSDTSFNGEVKTESMSAAATGVNSGGMSRSDTVIGPNSLTILKTPTDSATTAVSGGNASFDIQYESLGLQQHLLGAGNVAVYDFLGQDYLPGANGSLGTLVAQPTDCAAPIGISYSYLGNTDDSNNPIVGIAAPDVYYTTDTPAGFASTWTLATGNTLPTGVTGLKIIPKSSTGITGALLPIDGRGTVRVTLATASGATGRLCNGSVLTAQSFIPTATQLASLNLVAPCALSCTDYTQDSCGAISLTPPTVQGCGGATPTASVASDYTYPAGTTNVTWSVTAQDGTSVSCTQKVTITDAAAPTLACPSGGSDIHPAVQVPLDGCCRAHYTPTATATDSCTGTRTVSCGSVDFTAPGQTATSACSASNPNGGATSHCSASLVAVDKMGPRVAAGQIHGTADPKTGGLCANHPITVDFRFTDNCPCAAFAMAARVSDFARANVTQTSQTNIGGTAQAQFTLQKAGTWPLTILVKDCSGNVTRKDFPITVVDCPF